MTLWPRVPTSFSVITREIEKTEQILCDSQRFSELGFCTFAFSVVVCAVEDDKIPVFCWFYCVPAGVYEVNCRVTDHYSAGMRQQYRVNLCPNSNFKPAHTKPTKIVQYFIAAVEIEWDYSPQREWELELYQTTEEDRWLCSGVCHSLAWFVVVAVQ